MLEDFAVFILSHGRPENIKTIKTLEQHGYTGKYYIVIDNEDKTSAEYYRIYKDRVFMFDKAEIEKTIDPADNFFNRKTILHARCACFDIVKKIGIKYFIQLDDDYTTFWYKYNDELSPITGLKIKSLDVILNSMLKFYKSIKASSIAMAQTGDFLGGKDGNAAKRPQMRKCMNSFLCSTDRRFNFHGTMNEDVNTYTTLGSIGQLFLTIPFIALQQTASQSNAGGITETYLKFGTYVKAFYTVMHCPSSCKVSMMNSRHQRIHHSIAWENTTPKIIRESYKKPCDIT